MTDIVYPISETFTESWKIIPGWPKYQVSSKGRIKREDKILKAIPVLQSSRNTKLYKPLMITLSSGIKNTWTVKVAHLVLLAFVGPRPQGMLIRHLDDNQENNELSNLAWGTRKENTSDCLKNDRIKTGEKSPSATLTNKQVTEIRQSYKKFSRKFSLKELGLKYGVSYGTIHDIVKGVTWKQLQ